MRSKRSLVFNVLLINLSLIAVHWILFGTISVIYGKRSVEIRYQMADTIFSTADTNLTHELYRLDTATALCTDDASFVFTLSDRLNYAFFITHADEAAAKLAIIKHALPYAQNVYIYSSKADRVLQYTGSILEADTFFRQILPMENFRHMEDGFWKYGSNALYIRNLNNYGYMAVLIDMSEFAYINQNLDPDTYFYILDQDGNCLMENGSLPLTDVQLQEALSSERITVDGESYVCISRSLQRDCYTGILLISQSAFMVPINYFWIVCVISFVLLLAGSALALYLNFRLYLPLKNFTTSFGNGRNENEISFIENKIHDLLYEIYTLSEENAASRAVLPEKIVLHYLLYGGQQLGKVHLEPLQKKYDSFHVVVLALQTDEGQPAPQLAMAAERRLAASCAAQFVSMDKYVSVIISKAPVEEQIRELEEALGSAEGVQGYAGIRENCVDIIELNTEYRLALDHLRASRIVFGRTLTVDPKAGMPVRQEMNMSLQNSLYEYVSNGSTEQSAALLHGLFYEQAGITLQGFVDLYLHSISVIRQVLLAQNGACDLAFVEEGLYNTAYIYGLLEGYLAAVEALSLTGPADMKERILEYLKEHLTEELSLDSVAERFAISPTYLSSWFKKKTGVNFLSYISMLRMEKALLLLKQDRSIKVYELGQLVGIENAATFIRQFKKYTGMTPEQYRRSFLDSH